MVVVLQVGYQYNFMCEHGTVVHVNTLTHCESYTLLFSRFMSGSVYASPVLGCVLVIGRLMCASVEVWVLLAHIRGLLQQDEAVQRAA